MFGFIIFVFISFDGSSVSTARRGIALFTNPAGLAINSGYEGIYMGGGEGHKIGLSLKTVGLGIDIKQGDGLSFVMCSGFNISKNISIGYKYKVEGYSKYELGAMFRAKNFVSLGLVVPLESTPTIRAGIGIRPMTDRVTIFCDAIYKYDEDRLRNLIYGIGVEPIDGLIFSLKATGVKVEETSIQFGLDISFGTIKLWSEADKEFKNVERSVILSRTPYPTFIPRRKKIAQITIKGDYPEMSEEGIPFLFTKTEPKFYTLLNKLKQVQKRKDVECVFIQFKPYSMGIAQAEELRQELVKLKEAGKKIVTFSESYGLRDYYLASVADYIILTPLGEVILPGIMVKKMYLKGTLEKLGIETEIEQIGKYKSAREVFERENMSEEDREQITAYLEDVWTPILQEIATSRKIDEKKFAEFINEEVFLNSDNALKSKLVDTLAYWYEIDDVLEKYLGKKLMRKSIDRIFVDEVPRSWSKNKPKVALVIAEGSIVRGESGYSPFPIIGGKYMGSETISHLLEKIRKDKSIKAVVFRVNSRGGDGLASEIIAQTLRRVSKDKPVIVSMGNVAGSGGYYISCFGDTIVADRFTVTGSIGVLSIHPILKNLYAKLGITWDTVKYGEHADIFSNLRNFTPEERTRIRQEVEWFYDKFITRVAEGRGISPAKVDSIGQGRIWSGIRAQKIGLVDEIGGLMKAIEIACEKAKIKEPEIVIFPKPRTKFTLF